MGSSVRVRHVLRIHRPGLYACFASAGVVVAGVYELGSIPLGVATLESVLAALGLAAALTLPATQMLWGPLLAAMDELGLRRILWPVIRPVATAGLAAIGVFIERAFSRMAFLSMLFGAFFTIVAVLGTSIAALVLRSPRGPVPERRAAGDAL